MAFNRTLSAVLRGHWLIDKQWADAHRPLVFRLLKGEAVSFHDSEEVATLPTLERKVATRSVYSVRPGTQISTLPGESIVMVTLSGPLLKDGDLCSYGMIDHARLANELSRADNVAGVIYNIDSPGGQAAGTASLADAIKNLSKRKPVIAHVNDGMAASAAMWVASATNEIYCAQVTDQLGSVGVYTTIADWNNHYKEYFKLNVHDVYAPQSTDKNRDYREAINGNDDLIKGDLSMLADRFINTISANRSKATGDAWKTGKMFYAKDAVKHGLADGIKSFDQVVLRMDALIKSRNQNQNSKNMSFEKTLATAKADAFAVVDGGFLLEEEHLNSIETSLTRLADAEAELQAANAALAPLNERITTAETEVANSRETIANLNAQLAELNKQPSGSGSSLVVAADEPVEEIEKPVTLNSAEHPLNMWAASRLRKKTA